MTGSVKIFGERHCGTNLLGALITANSDSLLEPGTVRERSRVLGFGARLLTLTPSGREALADWVFRDGNPLHAWKHAATRFDHVVAFRGHTVLFIVKHPLSWLVSLARRPHHLPSSVPKNPTALAQFPVETWNRERLGRARLTPLQIWQEKVSSYLECASKLAESKVAHRIIRFEDLVDNQPRLIRELGELLVRPRSEPVGILRSTKRSHQTADDYATYYREEAWRGEYRPEDAEMLLARLDPKVLDQWGYR